MFPTIHRNTTIGLAQVNAVSARDLHEKLGVKTRINDWIRRRVEESLLLEGEDYVRYSAVSSDNPSAHNRVDFWLTLDAAKHIAMLERSEIGKAIRQYFIDIEKAAAEGAQENARLKSAMEDAQAALLEGLTAKVKALTPAAELGNAVTKGRTEWPVNMAAKELGVPRPVLTWAMRKNGFMSEYVDGRQIRVLPTEKGMDHGLFTRADRPFGFTPRGLKTAYGVLVAYGYDPKEVTV